MEQRRLGGQGLVVSALGLGCMGMSWAYGPRDDAESVATVHEAIDLGITFFDTAEVYGPYENEKLLGRALQGRRDRVVIATKFGFKIGPDGKTAGTDSRPEHVQAVVDASLQRLGTDHIDLFYQHRVDPNVPIEDTVGAMAEAVKAGKIRYLGLSEASPKTLRNIFVRHLAPYEPFAAKNNLPTIFREALRRAGLDKRMGRKGLYLLRHTLASRLLRTGSSIKAIADVLGHVHLSSTLVYTKVDLTNLETVVLSIEELLR
jgi:aryl-alcohol dehydrogenase-like predicted oxidoreductase